MLERSENGKKCAMINVSSVNSYELNKLKPVYCATTAFKANFSKAIEDLYKDKLDVITVCPSSVATQMNASKAPWVIKPEELVN